MMDAYNVADTVPELYPITYTPRALPQGAIGMKITPAQIPELADGAGLREAVKAFLGRWSDLLLAGPDAVSLVSTAQAGDVTRLNYIQANYPYPIVGQYGTMRISVSADGRLMDIDDRFIPTTDVPRPALDRAAAAQKVVGRTFDHSGGGSAPSHPATVTDARKISVRQIVVLPLKKSAGLQVHIAWQVDVTAPAGLTVYIDAVNGEELLVEPSD